MTLKQYILAFPTGIEHGKMQILDELAGRVSSEIMVKSKGQSRPVHVISFTGDHEHHVPDIKELMRVLSVPYNLRVIAGSDLIETHIYRIGMESAEVVSEDQLPSDDTNPAFDLPVSTEKSYEGVVLAGHDYASRSRGGLRH